MNWESNVDYPSWMTEEGLKTLERQHLLEGETPKQMYSRISNTLSGRLEQMLGNNASVENVPSLVAEFKEKWFKYMWNGWLCPSTPILSNCGTKRGFTVSCFILRVPDSIDGIYTKLHEMAMLTKMGGGVGVTFDKVRGRGEPISTGGFTEGIIPFIKVFDSAIVATSQGSVRRGAISVNLPVRHKDIKEFLKLRLPIGDVNRQSLNINHCVTIDDYFYESLLSGDTLSREIWSEILSARMRTGQPYIFNYHNANKNKPEDFKKRNLKIDGTNLCCLEGETEVITKEGIFKIKDLVGKTVTIFDGNDWVTCDNFAEFPQQQLFTLTFEDGTFLKCTEAHRHFVQGLGGKIIEKKTNELGWMESFQCYGSVGISKKSNYYKKCVSIAKDLVDVTYCPNIPTTGKFLLANGILTGNSEIILPHDFDHTVVCDLASINLSKFNEWKDDPDFIEACLLFLDCNLEEFIVSATGTPGFEPSINFAKKSRALGLGVLGWHTLLQQNQVPFNSIASKGYIKKIGSKMLIDGNSYNKKWGAILGNPEWCDENRNSTLFAIAPTTTNSLVSGGLSQGIEPVICNAWIQKSAKGTFIRKNRQFQRLMEKKYKEHNTDQLWNSIMTEFKGSVQHLPFLTDEEKEVFLTAYEINQYELVKNAGIWQQYIDQGMSLNLFFPSDVDPKWLNKVHLTAWQEGLKSLYYVRTESILSRNMKSSTFSDCLYCES